MPAARVSLVDTHVHFSPGAEEARFFDGALGHFREASGTLPPRTKSRYCLVLTQECEREDFRRWRRRAEERPAPGTSHRSRSEGEWGFVSTEEPESLIASRGPDASIVVVAGRQVQTRERLEVLALGTDGPLESGREAGTLMESVREAGGMPVLAWGFGKWWGRRGRRVVELVREARPGELCLGDQRGRPRSWPAPRPFREAVDRGIPVLPGSDPLPVGPSRNTAGSYGLVLEHDLGTRRPASELLKTLAETRSQPERYGKRDGLHRCLIDQMRLQATNRESR